MQIFSHTKTFRFHSKGQAPHNNTLLKNRNNKKNGAATHLIISHSIPMGIKKLRMKCVFFLFDNIGIQLVKRTINPDPSDRAPFVLQ